MAGVTAWLAAILALLPPLAVGGYSAWRGAAGARLVAVQLVTSVTILMLALMTFAYDQPSFIDLPLALALLAAPATLVIALFLERWL